MRGPLAAAALAAALAVSGCSTADTAAIVNGEVISETEAQLAATQINEAFNPEQPLDTPGAVASLIAASTINEIALKAGKGESESSARAAMPNLADPAESTIELVKSNFAWQKLSDAEKQAALETLKKADVTVNPRYGTFNAENAGFQQSAPNWLAPAQPPQTPGQG
jgi:hypothetical protein